MGAQVAQHLSSSEEAILDGWCATVREDPAIPSATTLSYIAFLDHIPGILNAIRQDLRASSRDVREPAISVDGEQHGMNR